MPPRKIDPAKRGDTSMAQFVYDGDIDQTERSSAVPPQFKHTTSASSSTPATQMETDDPAESSLLVEKEKEKDKDKEREKKDKEKEKDSSKDAVTIEDLTLPKSIITRLAKGVLPSNTQIQANAILAMSKSATIFVNHLANAANEHTLNNNKKTIMPADVFAALDDIEFPFFRERLEAEFKKFNDTQTSKRNTYRRKVAAQKKAEKPDPDAADPNTSLISNASTATDSNSAPRSKKQKPNAAHEESAMDVDEDETQEPHDASDADTEPEQEPEEDDDEDEEDQENAEDEEDEEENDDEENEDEVHDRLEERQDPCAELSLHQDLLHLTTFIVKKSGVAEATFREYVMVMAWGVGLKQGHAVGSSRARALHRKIIYAGKPGMCGLGRYLHEATRGTMNSQTADGTVPGPRISLQAPRTRRPGPRM
ncbi:hypothetical protein GQX73_g9232 [Xylaria multiplex]|uniref:DNA polymerase epsilon subunit D n=1 Tax=Xylaria multiplex TaxID=323545 RepID=A0A7C8MJT0_9PEZI|nr:hypothetical protein GQX73_g9232 [Xylaria multiplex]